MGQPDARSGPEEGLGRADRIRRRAEFREVQSRGQRVHTPHFILIVYPREGMGKRLGITVTRKIGSAVRRNRVKRLVREVFRRHRTRFPEGCDVVVIAKKGAPELDYGTVLSEVTTAEDALSVAAQRARTRLMGVAAGPARPKERGR